MTRPKINDLYLDLCTISRKIAIEEGLGLKEFVRSCKGAVGRCHSDGTIEIKMNQSRYMEPEILISENARTFAHELAHLKHMHHGKEFWEYAAYLCGKFSCELGVKVHPEKSIVRERYIR